MKMPGLERGQPEPWPEEPAWGWGLGRQAVKGLNLSLLCLLHLLLGRWILYH